MKKRPYALGTETLTLLITSDMLFNSILGKTSWLFVGDVTHSIPERISGPALVYVTSSNRVIFYNARLSLMIPTNLDITMKRRASQDKQARIALSTVAADSGNNNGLTQLYAQSFYGKNSS